jgi:hypothetical protein
MPSDTFEARYEVEDGYAGKSRPQRFKIRSGDLEGDMSDAELEKLFSVAVQDDFEQRIYPTEGNVEEFKTWAKWCLAERKAMK